MLAFLLWRTGSVSGSAFGFARQNSLYYHKTATYKIKPLSTWYNAFIIQLMKFPLTKHDSHLLQSLRRVSTPNSGDEFNPVHTHTTQVLL